MLRCKIFSSWIWSWCLSRLVFMLLPFCVGFAESQSSNKNRDVKRDQTFKYIANVEGYKIVMTTINLSVEIFTSMCYPECLRQSRTSQVGCDPKKIGKVSDDNAWLKIWIKKLACRRAPTKVRNVVVLCIVMWCIVLWCRVSQFYLSVTRKIASQLPLTNPIDKSW